MNAKQFESSLENVLVDQNRVMASYRKKGYVTSQSDEDNLHMAFSPNRVPRKLSKSQVRRRISQYKKHGNSKSLFEMLGHRLTVKINDKLVVGVSFTGEIPNTIRKLKNFLNKVL